MKLLTKLTALIAGIAVLGTTSIVANAAPKMQSHKTSHMKTKVVHVKGYTRHLKNGKTVKVKASVRHIAVKTKMKSKTKM